MTRRFLLIAVAVFVGVSVDCRADQSAIYHLSFRALHFASGERVSKFDLHLRSAMIVGFRTIPVGWQINIDNDPSWMTEVSGTAVVGAADLEASALRPWFVSVLPEPDGRSERVGEIAIEGSITLSNGDQARTIAVTSHDVALIAASR
jgi:hypothetical protein